jgi:hypothetical protein
MEARKYISPQTFTQRSRGDYDYRTAGRYLLDQNPNKLAERSLGNPVYYGDQIGIFWFVNDTWKIKRNVTVNIGLRHEYTTIPIGERQQSLNVAATVPGLVDFHEPRAPKTNFMPRLGVAWSPGGSGTTSVRAGFAMGYDVMYDNIGILSLPPQLSGTIDTPFAPTTTNYLGSGGIPPAPGGLKSFNPPTAACVRAGIAGGAPCQQFSTANQIFVDQKDPAAIQYDLSVQHSFGSKYTVEARYLGTHGYHLDVQERLNRFSPLTGTAFLPTFLAAPTQATLNALPNNLAALQGLSSFVPTYVANNFGFRNLVSFRPDGASRYNSLAVQGTRRFSQGLQFTAAYTWSHLLDNSTADVFSTLLTPRRSQDFQNLKADWGTSALDRRHRLSLAVYYDLPYFKSGNWMTRNLLGNWLFAPIYTYQSPEYADVQSGLDSNLNGDAAGDRALVNPAGVAGTGSGVNPLCTSALPAGANCGDSGTEPFIVAYQAINPKAQYLTAGSGALIANNGLRIASRNTIRTRPTNNFDLTASKKFNITEGIKFEFQAQFLNLMNHSQFAPGFINRVDFPTNVFTGGAISSYLDPSSSSFNQPQQTFSNNARQIQLTAKFSF